MELSNEQKVQAINEVIALYEKREWHPHNFSNAPYICIDLRFVIKDMLNYYNPDKAIDKAIDLIPELLFLKPWYRNKKRAWFSYMNFTIRIKKLKELRVIIEENKTTS